MLCLNDYEIEKLISDDIPYFDLTSYVCGIEGKQGTMRYETREKTLLCGVEEAQKVLQKMGLKTLCHNSSGDLLESGNCFLEARGDASALHQGWRVSLNLMEHASGIATRTYNFVQKAKSFNQNINIVTTRKNFPGLKKLSIKAILSGGALPHRLGLSETILVFDEHIRFMGGMSEFLKQIDSIKSKAAEKKVVVEAHNSEDAIFLAQNGVDAVQLDKFTPDIIKSLIPQLKRYKNDIVIVAAGGVNMQNVGEYADSGVNAIATSALFFGKPADIKVHLESE